MTSLTTRSDPTTTPATGSAPVLITEQQVLWGTAVARFAPTPAKNQKPRAPRLIPKRHAWLETALMAREMDRL